MRDVIATTPELDVIPIQEIDIDPKSNDDTPVTLRGLQALHADAEALGRVLALLNADILPDTDRGLGRPGMSLWRILVVAVLKQSLDCDFERLVHMANHDTLLRQMMQHGYWAEGKSRYSLQCLIDNVRLLDVDLLRKIDQEIVHLGLRVAGTQPDDKLHGRCDSFVVETNVEHPTDVRLTWRAIVLLVMIAVRAAAAEGKKGWRQYKYLLGCLSGAFQKVRTAKQYRTRPDLLNAFLNRCASLLDKCQQTLGQLSDEGWRAKVQEAHDTATHLYNLTVRRLVEGETIPNDEKIYSLHAPHTRWNAKGKAGRPVELGVPVAVVESAGFVLDHEVMFEGTDKSVAVPLLRRCTKLFPALSLCSFDRGFYSKANLEALREILDTVVLPKPGRLNEEERAREEEEDFVKARKRHSGVESCINNLEQHGCQRVRTRGGREGFERTVALSVLSANVHRVGLLLQRKEQKRLRARRRAA